MKLIVGLGNPGEKYETTRHNLGFVVLERFLRDFSSLGKSVWENQDKLKSVICQIEWQRQRGKKGLPAGRQGLEKVILVKPKTYMNNSGMAVALISNYYKVAPENIWILNDDIDLPLGTMKIRFGGASAGHHGVESVIKALGTDKFWRFRLGTGEKKELIDERGKKVDEFVLGRFSGGEKGKVKELIKRAVKAIETSLEEGLEKAMNRFNTK